MIHNITITDLSAIPGIITLEDDFALAEELTKLPNVNSSFKTDMLMLLFCLKGHIQITFGDREVQQIDTGEAYICKPRKTIQQLLTSSDCQTWVLFFSPRVVDHMLPAKHDVTKVLEVEFQPLVHYGERYMSDRIFPLLNMLKQRALNPRLPFRSHTMYHLFAVLLFEIINTCCEEKTLTAQTQGTTSAENTSYSEQSSRADTLFKLFVKHLSEDNGCHRTVAYYADLLCVSPKHLSKIIKDKTGSNALQVITQHAIQQIKLDLKLTDMPIKELANKYNFSNYSFFCQFVKSHLGVTPQEYREA